MGKSSKVIGSGGGVQVSKGQKGLLCRAFQIRYYENAKLHSTS